MYREGLQRILDDLFNPGACSLLMPCANARSGHRINTAAFLPNPAHASPLALSMFEFVGRLMGMSMRTKAALPFAFPSLVWKGLVGEAPEAEDLAATDAGFAAYLARLRHCDADTGPEGEAQEAVRGEEAFAAAFPGAVWTVVNGAGEEVELVPGGGGMPLTFASRAAYADAALAFRLRECDQAVAAIRRGLANMVPIRALALFTWVEAEALVCGRAHIDLPTLRRHTRYEGVYNKEHAVVKRFWRVLAGMSHEDRSRYVRFAWGRSRLPAEGAAWTSSHTLTRLSGGDAALPMAHTCFFTLDLPEYSSDERMLWGLTTAMNYGIGGILNG